MSSRPRGVTIIGFFALLFGFFLLVSGVSLITTKSLTLQIFMKEYKQIVAQLNATGIGENMIAQLYDAVAYAAIIVGVIYAIVGMGLLSMQSWARIVAVILAGINVVYSLFVVFLDPLAIVSIVINVLIIWYLMRPDVRESFGKKMSIEERILGES